MATLLQQPALKTPPGVVSQFPSTHAPVQAAFYPTAVLATVIPGLLFTIRIYTKSQIIRKLDWSDLTLALAWPFFIALIIVGKLCVDNGGGAHQWNLTNEQFIKVAYYFYVVEIVYGPCIFFVKTAILLQYLRTFAPQRGVNPFMWWSARVVIVVTAAYYTISTMITAFSCTPRAAAWNPLITGYRCLNNSLLVVITCVFNIISDMFILLLPARAVWKLRIATKKKIGIILLFGLGLLACVANAMIIYYFFQAAGANADISYNVCWAGFWGFAEVSFGLIVSSAFLLPKFMDAKAADLKGLLSSLTKPVSSLTSGSFGLTSFSRSRKDMSVEDSTHRSASPEMLSKTRTTTKIESVTESEVPPLPPLTPTPSRQSIPRKPLPQVYHYEV